MFTFPNTVTVLVTVCLVNIFIHTSLSFDIIDGKYSLDSSFDPIKNKQECNNYYTNNEKVCDPQNYITYPMKEKLGEIMERAKNIPTISCPFKTDGIEFGVFVMSSFNDYHCDKRNEGFDVGESSKFYAKLFHEKWEIGSEECNNGILIFLNIEDRYLYISTSTFIKQNYISDDYINNQVMPNIRSYLKDGQYADGIIKIMELITDKCQEQLVDKIVESEGGKEQEMARQERERKERERQQREQIEREKIERERKEKERRAKERKKREQIARDRQERKRIETERKEKERQERERIERDRKGDQRKENSFGHDNNSTLVGGDGIRIFVGVIMFIVSICWFLWFIGYKIFCCFCCDDDSVENDSVDNYGDEGVPSHSRSYSEQHTLDEPGMYGNNDIHLRRNRNNNNDNNYRYQWERQEMQRKERERKERERKEKERKKRERERKEREKQERERRTKEKQERERKAKNEALVNKGKRIKNGGGGGMDWNDNNSNLKRTGNNDGAGMSWNDDYYKNERERKERIQKERERQERESIERERKERERKEREKQEKARIEKENKEKMNGGGGGMSWSKTNNKRTGNNDGAGMSWNDDNDKRTNQGGGGGMSWSNENKKDSQKFKRTNANDGGGGGW